MTVRNVQKNLCLSQTSDQNFHPHKICYLERYTHVLSIDVVVHQHPTTCTPVTPLPSFSATFPPTSSNQETKLQHQQLQKQNPMLAGHHEGGKQKSIVILTTDSSHSDVFPIEVCDGPTAFGCSLGAPQVSLKPLMIIDDHH